MNAKPEMGETHKVRLVWNYSFLSSHMGKRHFYAHTPSRCSLPIYFSEASHSVILSGSSFVNKEIK